MCGLSQTHSTRSLCLLLFLHLTHGCLCPSPSTSAFLLSFSLGILQTVLPDLTPAETSGSIPGLEEGDTDPWTSSQLKNTNQLKGRTGVVTQHTGRPLASPFPAEYSLALLECTS